MVQYTQVFYAIGTAKICHMSQHWLLLKIASSSFDLCKLYMNATFKESDGIM